MRNDSHDHNNTIVVPVEIDWELLFAFSEAENKPHNKDWLIRWRGGVYYTQRWGGYASRPTEFIHHVNGGEYRGTIRQICRMMRNPNFDMDSHVLDVIHIPTNTSFRM